MMPVSHVRLPAGRAADDGEMEALASAWGQLDLHGEKVA